MIKDAANNRLDPETWAKPLLCHTYGPYLTILSVVEDPLVFGLVECTGGKKMLADYTAFVKQRA